MIDHYLQEWNTRGIGVLLIGGQVMLKEGLREQTKDIDACLTALQCPKMLDWLIDKDRQGADVQIRAGSAPLHEDWLSRGWTCHIEIDSADRLDFFGIPFRAPDRLIERFSADPSRAECASLIELGYLKRTERPQDWSDVELILGRLRERHKAPASLIHQFGDLLAAELLAHRDRPDFRNSLLSSSEAEERPILRLGLSASEDELYGMALAERDFLIRMSVLRTRQIRAKLKAFWRKHSDVIGAGKAFPTRHAALLAAARVDLACAPVDDPVALIDQARVQSGVDRWPGLLPDSDKIAAQYFPEFRAQLALAVRDAVGPPMPFAARLSPEERERFERIHDEVLLEHWGIDRFEAYRKRFAPPTWLANIPLRAEEDPHGRLPRLVESSA